jgi:anti-repressor protein
MQFSHDVALSLNQSPEPFPIDFDDGWKWLGWKKKQDAKSVLLNNFEEEIDFLRKGVKSSTGGRPSEFIGVTIDCFKSLAMMAGTERGKEVRSYFLKCERIAKLAVETIPAQATEIEKLKLELELAKTQERLLATTNAIATLHGTQMLALMMGSPDAIVTKTERVETLVAVDGNGKAIASFDGIGITYLAKRYGFGKNTKACRYWLESIGVKDEQWITEPTLVKTQKLSRVLLPWLDRQYSAKQGVRQRLLGE